MPFLALQGLIDPLIHYFPRVYSGTGKVTLSLCQRTFELSDKAIEAHLWTPPRLRASSLDASVSHRRRRSPRGTKRDSLGLPGRNVVHGHCRYRLNCLSCRCLSICHGGCPVRTYSALGTMLTKDPYCEVYKAVFGRAETHSREILRRQVTAWKH